MKPLTLKEIRERRYNMNIKEFAEFVDIPYHNYRRKENGTRSLTAKELAQICNKCKLCCKEIKL